MFSPGTKRPNSSSRKERTQRHIAPDDSPATPLSGHRRSQHDGSVVPNRPSSGTPAPWAPRLSVLARIPAANKNEKGDEIDQTKPVYVEEFPQVVRDEQAAMLQKRMSGEACISGGIDKGTSLSWIICGSKLFVWSLLSSTASRKCVVLQFPSDVSNDVHIGKSSHLRNGWLLCFVHWDSVHTRTNKGVQQSRSVGVVICNQNSRAVIYWPDIYSEDGNAPITSLASENEIEETSSAADGKTTPNKPRQRIGLGGNLVGSSYANSLIASAIPDNRHVCVALACCSSGELWQFYCSPTGIQRSKVYHNMLSLTSHGVDSGQYLGSKGYPRSMIWRFPIHQLVEFNREFLLLTDQEIQCYSIQLSPDSNVSQLWSCGIIGTDGDFGIKKDLAGQKRIWPLEIRVDDRGKEISILIATFCKDRVSSSSYTQYSLMTVHYKSGVNISGKERVLEEKAPIQVIIPKARVEDEDFLFSMRLRVGGKPSGSAVILSGDGTATVSHYYGNSTRLYQFDLPYDGGKVLDASVLPSADDGEGAWVVLTEKAGIWAIPEKAVLIGGVEPPERSLSRKGSSNERSSQEEQRNLTFTANIAPRRASSEARDAGDKHRAVMSGIARRSAQDEESDAILGHIFHEFLLSGQVDGSLEKLRHSGAFERDGETNIFARTSKSIVDSLAKHWTTTRGAEIVAMAVVSNQLIDKQQKHQKLLQFLALSKCHEELCSRQRHALQSILEHGEKLVAMIRLRELQNAISQNRTQYSGPESEVSGALWDLVQLVGERARRNTVLLMDRDNAEVFYSKVSDLEEVFHCLDEHLEYLISTEMPFLTQIQRAGELSNACVTILRTAIQFRTEHQMWYPPPEGLTPWYCEPVVRKGMWSVASFMLQLLKEASGFNMSARSDIYSHLEVLAEVILEAYAGAITAKVERGEEPKGLLDEYWNRRDALLDSLYQQAKGFAEAGCQELSDGAEEQIKETLRKLSSHLLSITKRHEGYKTMWDLCCDLNDSILLKSLMHESVGPRGGFSYFVCEQMYEKKQFSKLLRLGEEFQEELSIFLKQHQDLRWLHEIFLNQFSSASETLHALALSQDENSISSAEEGMDLEYTNMEPSLADRKRLLNLSKIASMAACMDNDNSTRVKRIEADLKLLKLQEEIVGLLPDDGVKQNIGHRLQRPEDLINLCLEGGIAELSLRAFDVFSWTSSSFRKSHKTLLEECWRNAADHDDWSKLHQAHTAEGWGDEENFQVLSNTVLFQASSRCYGPLAETFEEGFDEVMPLRQENTEGSSGLKETGSVEAILMQHKDFPDAGKLMLTAIMLGSVEGDVEGDDSAAADME